MCGFVIAVWCGSWTIRQQLTDVSNNRCVDGSSEAVITRLASNSCLDVRFATETCVLLMRFRGLRSLQRHRSNTDCSSAFKVHSNSGLRRHRDRNFSIYLQSAPKQPYTSESADHCILSESAFNRKNILKWGAAIAQWIHLCLPSCCPGFKSWACFCCVIGIWK